ncbi:MAG: hypothetical protein K2N38_09325 [Oscillospiraceae bacterium]|nr:hypothetical protein [Oscillospiraceae bacterium]
MKGLKLLFDSWKKMSFFFWFGIAFSLVLAVLPFFFNEEVTAEDYMFPKMFIFFPSFFMTEIGLICGCRDIAGNKLVRSFPIAKELYTKSVPMYITILTLGISAVSVIAYFIFLGIIGADAAQFADTLIIGAIVIAPELIVSGFFASIPGGGLFGVYVVALPIVLISTIGGNTVMRKGFGASVSTAAVIFAAAVTVSIVLMFIIARWRYKTSNIKINNMIMNYETK